MNPWTGRWLLQTSPPEPRPVSVTMCQSAGHSVARIVRAEFFTDPALT
jgi:hypothetical protein